MKTIAELAKRIEARQYRPKCDRWCKFCGRKHNPVDYCKLYYRERTAKSGQKVRRWAP